MKYKHLTGALLILCLFIQSFDVAIAQSIKINADVAGSTDVNEMRLGYNPSTGVYYQNSYQNNSYNNLYFSQSCSLQPNLSIDTALTTKLSSLKPQVLRFPGGEEANYYHFYNGKDMDDTTCFQSNESWNKGNGYNIEEVLFKAPFYHAVNAVQYDPMFNRNYIFDFVDMVKEMERINGESIEVLFVANLLQFFKHQSILHLIPECLDPQESCFQDKLQEIVNAISFLKLHGINVVGVELGNEMWADHKMKVGGSNEVTANSYFQLCNEVSDRLKSEFNNIPVGILVHQAACYNEESERKKWNNELKIFFENPENRQKYDALVLHAYYDAFNKNKKFGQCADYDFGNYKEDDIFSRKYVLDYLEEIHNISTDKEIWYTEWNGSKSNDFNLDQKLKHAMFIQNMIMSFLEFNRAKGKTIIKYENLHTAAGVGDADGATTQLLRMNPPLNSIGKVNDKSRKANFTSTGFVVGEQLVPILNNNRPLFKLETESNISYKDILINDVFTDLFFIEEGDSKQLLLYYVNKGPDSIFLNIGSIINSSTQKGYLQGPIKHQYIRTGSSPSTSMLGVSLTDESLYTEIDKQSNLSDMHLKGYAMGYVIIELAEVSSCAYFDVIPTECQSNYTFIPKETEGLHKWIIKGDSTIYSDTTLTYSFVEGSHTIYHVFSSDLCSIDTFEYNLSIKPKISLDYLVVQNETCHQKNGGFNIKIVGGASPYRIKYNNKEVLVNSNVFSFGSLGAGNYIFNITDHHNCSIDTQFTIIDTAVGLCDFVTVWDLSKKGFFLNDNISFFKDVAKGGTTYTWEEISPGSAKGSGKIKAGEGPVLLSGFPKNAVIRLAISHENLNKFYINKNENRMRLVEVEQWGIAGWKSMENAFSGCNNLDVTATDIPDLTDVFSMSKMFLGCNSLNGFPNFNDWNTESVQNFSQMFMNAGSFNQDISNWDTKNATDMSNMFRNATSFNQNINDWITDNVVNMASMFSEASSFNQSIGNWMLNPDVNMTGMLDNSGMDCEVYSRVLKDWSSNPVTPNDRILGANAMEYGTWNIC